MFDLNLLSKIIKHKFFKNNDPNPIIWKGFVTDVDYDGTKFESKIQGSIKVRINGLYDFIDDNDLLPEVLPFFYKSGLNILPQIDDWVYVIFQYLEPVGQAYYISLVQPNQKPENIIVNPITQSEIKFKDVLTTPKKEIILPIENNVITKKVLDDDTYFQQEFDKNLIVIHHTADGRDDVTPEDIIDFWNNDNREVGTAYIIGLDGNIVQCFESDKMWAYHLKAPLNSLEKRSIGIELINPGPVYDKITHYQNQTGQKEKGNVVDVGRWRDYQYFVEYSNEQIKSLNDLISYLCKKHNIKKVIPDDFFEFNKSHLAHEGIIGHSGLRSDKTDPHLKFPIDQIDINKT